MTEWHRVVFSDESRFCLSSDSRRVRVWRRRGERSNPAAIVEHPNGTMTAQRYVDYVLRPVTLPYLQGVPNALYQQDNARPHTARISQQALQDVQMLPWPPYSPDLSPIEHVWDIIGRRLHALPQPRSEDELWQMNYFQVRQILLDLYPESSEASFGKYFAMKLTGQSDLETYYREKTAMGLQLGLPQEVILETLTEGLPFSDQRLVRVVPPENLGEWFRLAQRIHGPSVPTTRHREEHPPTMSGPYHNTPRRTGAWTAPPPPSNYDLIIAETSKEINDNLASEIEKYVTLTEKKDSESFIGIEIKREEDGFYLSQTHYIDTFLHRFGLEECNSVQTPGDQNQNLDEYLDSKPVDKTVYQEMIGSQVPFYEYSTGHILQRQQFITV
ncbi:hypothetical protein LAZ67_9001837 [Cordylochernes scorpioides]|uniref:Tc1-like transposase DDE domain-containing protein n=1 Tax=Cordylochernes scorpioides TaxID=51811 RepID=A0ABY6KTD4_9ARAC|nr:hypothetical protein LAZ67_9001837 [Cordylochernes scorpioides]